MATDWLLIDGSSVMFRAFFGIPVTAFKAPDGQPAISLPLATSKAGLPIGIQLVGRPRDEYSILSLGAQLEAAVRPPAAVASSG